MLILGTTVKMFTLAPIQYMDFVFCTQMTKSVLKNSEEIFVVNTFYTFNVFAGNMFM